MLSVLDEKSENGAVGEGLAGGGDGSGQSVGGHGGVDVGGDGEGAPGVELAVDEEYVGAVGGVPAAVFGVEGGGVGAVAGAGAKLADAIKLDPPI
jgi:hypothetical protein